MSEVAIQEKPMNALAKAKADGEHAYQELITKNEFAAHKLKKIAEELHAASALLESWRRAATDKAAAMVGEAWELLGEDYNSFTAWWTDPATWEEASGLTGSWAPFHVNKALQLKRLHDFTTGSMIGKLIGRPKNPSGFTNEALFELLAPKYVKDKDGRELKDSKDERTPESQQRLDVIEKVYSTLKGRADNRASRARKAGKEPVLITRQEVVDALQTAFKEAGMNVVHPKVRRITLEEQLKKIRNEMVAWYYNFEGQPEKLAALKAKVYQCLAEWDEWEEGDGGY